MGARTSGRHLAGLGLILGATALMAAAQLTLDQVNERWFDEYFAFWASDPSIPFREALRDRIFPDPNPILYFSLLYGVRSLGLNEGASVLLINAAAVLLCLAIGWRAVSRAHLPMFGAFGLAAGLSCGAMLIFVSEGRAYAIAAACGLALSAIAFSALAWRADARDFVLAGLVSALAALTHTYAALFAGAVGAGLVLCGRFREGGRHRDDLTGLGLVIGLSASVVFFAWIAAALQAGGFGAIGEGKFWLTFTLDSVRTALGLAKRLAFGPNAVFALTAVSVLALLAHRRTWREALLLGVIVAVFFLLPLLVSFHTPMVHGRYFAVAAPALVFGVVMLARAGAGERLEVMARAPTGALAAAMACLSLIATIPLHFGYAYDHVRAKAGWRGADLALDQARGCTGEVRVISMPAAPQLFAYLFETRGLAARARDAKTAPPQDVSDAPCALLGWGEHITKLDKPATALSDEEILALLGLTNTRRAPLAVARHRSGFVVLKASGGET